MLVGLVGLPSSGKTEVARWLASTHGFKAMRLKSTSASTTVEENEQLCTAEEVLHIVMPNYKENFVVYPIETLADLLSFRKRPFFLLLCVDSPTIQRFSFAKLKQPTLSLETFVQADDHILYGPLALRGRMVSADMTIFNQGKLEDLYAQLSRADICNPEHLRPSWDMYFMLLANLAARRSNCMKRRVGAVLVRTFRVIATGYNGTPRNTRNCNEGGCPRCNSNAGRGQGLDLCLCLHAEENALLEAGRERSDGATLYCSACPCLGCAKKIVQSGVRHVLYSEKYGMDEMSQALFDEAGVTLRKLRTSQCLHIFGQNLTDDNAVEKNETVS